VTTGYTEDGHERLRELLVADWGEGLEAEERAELERLARENPDVVLECERAAAAAAVAFAFEAPAPRLPPGLEAKILAAAPAHVAAAPMPAAEPSARGGPRAVELGAPEGLRAVDGGRSEGASDPSKASRRAGPAWWMALAASVALAVAGWLPRLGSEPPPPEPIVVEKIVEPPPPPSPAERLKKLETIREQTRAIPWTTTEDPWVERVDGRVVWNNDLQEGYMTFAGLPENDPAEHRYQLWIFDAKRDERFPVDGGVFDVPVDGAETVVPIRAKLPVREPTLFAVTLEGPDGVVVSDRSHILVVAQVD